jgi:hypothetical protein
MTPRPRIIKQRLILRLVDKKIPKIYGKTRSSKGAVEKLSDGYLPKPYYNSVLQIWKVQRLRYAHAHFSLPPSFCPFPIWIWGKGKNTREGEKTGQCRTGQAGRISLF